MPKETFLWQHNVGVEKTQVPGSGSFTDGEGQPMLDEWTLVFVDRQGGHDEIRFKFQKDVRDYLVRELTGGVVLAGGDLPSI